MKKHLAPQILNVLETCNLKLNSPKPFPNENDLRERECGGERRERGKCMHS